MAYEEGNAAEVIRDLANASGTPKDLGDGVKGVLIPDSHHLREIDHREDDQPYRKRGAANLHDVSSFVHYVARHKDDRTTLWGTPEGAFTAVLNDDSIEPDWRDHRASLALKTTPEWNDWNGISGRWQTQDDLAEFLDNHRPDVTDPVAADILEIVQTLQVNKDASFSRATRLGNGEVKFAYNETVDGKAGRAGEFSIPPYITVALAPWFGTPATELRGMFRYKLRDGNLSVQIKLMDVERVLYDLVREVATSLETELALPVLWGTAPAPAATILT